MSFAEKWGSQQTSSSSHWQAWLFFFVVLLVVTLPLLTFILGGLRLLESIEVTWRGMEFGKEFWELLSLSIIMLMPMYECNMQYLVCSRKSRNTVLDAVVVL